MSQDAKEIQGNQEVISEQMANQKEQLDQVREEQKVLSQTVDASESSIREMRDKIRSLEKQLEIQTKLVGNHINLDNTSKPLDTAIDMNVKETLGEPDEKACLLLKRSDADLEQSDNKNSHKNTESNSVKDNTENTDLIEYPLKVKYKVSDTTKKLREKQGIEIYHGILGNPSCYQCEDMIARIAYDFHERHINYFKEPVDKEDKSTILNIVGKAVVKEMDETRTFGEAVAKILNKVCIGYKNHEIHNPSSVYEFLNFCLDFAVESDRLLPSESSKAKEAKLLCSRMPVGEHAINRRLDEIMSLFNS
jgi:hypothetical protein